MKLAIFAGTTYQVVRSNRKSTTLASLTDGFTFSQPTSEIEIICKHERTIIEPPIAVYCGDCKIKLRDYEQ